MRAGNWAEPVIGLPQSECVAEVELESVQFLLHCTRQTVLDRLALNDGFGICRFRLIKIRIQEETHSGLELARLHVVLQHQVAELQVQNLLQSGIGGKAGI